mgnify:CR=1 FL=1
MNERIKELSIKAGFPEWSNHAIEFELEKFAELIVRECSDLFEIEWGDGKLTGNDVGYLIKKHFGVEE